MTLDSWLIESEGWRVNESGFDTMQANNTLSFALAVRSRGADCILLLSLVPEFKLRQKGTGALYTYKNHSLNSSLGRMKEKKKLIPKSSTQAFEVQA